MTRQKQILILVVVHIFLLPWPASAAAKEPSKAEVAFFEQKVRPILIEHCFGCHSATAPKLKGGLRLDTRAAIVQGGDSGPAAVPGDPDRSLLIRAVRYQDMSLAMPPKGKLAAREIAHLEEWVRQGMAFPDAPAEGTRPRTVDISAGKHFWAFQPLRAAPPPVDGASGNRIDAWVDAELKRRKLQAHGPAPRAALLRRAKFDLLGLPPTPEEIDEFDRDPSPTAFADRIERFLASPQYGERWARMWLDLVRYCDVAEQWAEFKGQPFRYRDWVVDALNRDLPFDRFVKLQLAADLLADARPEDRAALGFLGLSPTYWKELQLPVEIIKMIVSDEYEERIHTLSSTLWGLNLACARCHDHKFDPFTQRDYYALAGVFASTKLTDQALAADRDGEAIARAREDIAKLEGELRALASKSGQDAEAKKRELQGRLEKLKATPGLDAPLAPGVRDASLEVVPAKGSHGSRLVYHDRAQDLAIEIRGNPNKPGPVIPRGFPAVLSQGTPRNFREGSGRRELAEAIFEESGHLVARVIVNRVWRHHFGVGIVDTPSDFGSQGDPPSHPELLDDLASRFVENGWSLKWLHREIMSSAAYQRASGTPPASDAQHRFYSIFPRRRLDVEAWRDGTLHVAGVLDSTIGGPPTELHTAGFYRRTLYGLVRRRELSDLLRLHDFPDPLTHSPHRIPTLTPLQQLFTLNSPFMLEVSAALANRLAREAGADAAARIDRAYRLLFGRLPTEEERMLGLRFVADGTPRVWQQYAQVLLGSNEFHFLD